MFKYSSYKYFQIIIANYIKLIDNNENLHKQLKEILIILKANNYINENIYCLDLRRAKDKEKLLQYANSYLKSKLISKIILNERGWTKELIDKYLESPDLFEINPQTRRHLYLYSLCKIEYLESLEEIKSYLTLSCTKPLDKNQDIYKWLEELNISIPVLNIEALLKNSLNIYNRSIATNKSEQKSLFTKSNILESLCFNYLRHDCTKYDLNLVYLNIEFNTEFSCAKFKEFVNQKINEAYPNLKSKIYQYQKNNGYIEQNTNRRSYGNSY